MGQKLRDDKIGALSHSGGVITMTASALNPVWLTIGGQQYKVTSNLVRTIATDVALAVNTLYMIYAVKNAGNIELRVSSNVNSTGPAGFSSWLLVGAFYSNGLTPVGLGVFVNIEGPVVTETWDAGPVRWFSGGVALNKGTMFTDKSTAQRVGDTLVFAFTLNKNVSDGSATAGTYGIRTPAAFVVSDTKMALSGGENFRTRNSGHISTSGDGRIGVMNYGGVSEFSFQFANGATNSSATTATHPFGNPFFFTGLFVAPINGWDSRSLKDL